MSSAALTIRPKFVKNLPPKQYANGRPKRPQGFWPAFARALNRKPGRWAYAPEGTKEGLLRVVSVRFRLNWTQRGDNLFVRAIPRRLLNGKG